MTARAPLLPPERLAEILRHAEAGYPDEVCGMVIGTPGSPDSFRVRPVRNIADAEPQPDPVGRPRTARTAYLMDPREQLRILQELDAAAESVIVFYHSHPDHAAYFSAMDREHALLRGEPIWPGPSYLVVSVRGGRTHSASWFTWDPARRDFYAESIAVPSSLSAEEQG
jgi:[CysO sulfur-carrier protein]-S-L-cysteine hydrolase